MQRLPIVGIVIGVAATALGFATDIQRAALDLMICGFYAVSVGVLAMFFLSTQRLSSAKWSASIRRIPEALTRVVPAGILLLAIVAVAFHNIWPWMDPAHANPEQWANIKDGFKLENGVIAHAGREVYLAPAFVYARMIICAVLWLAFTFWFRKTSANADASKQAGRAAHSKLNKIGGAFAVLFAFSFTAVAFDFIVSLTPDWFTTMYAVFVFAGSFALSIATIALTLVLLIKHGKLGPNARTQFHEPLHTLGTFLLAFSTFWAYIWTCQYLLIWYGNIPEEVKFYLPRSNSTWLWIFLANVFINWIIPFFTLLPRTSKRSLKIMQAMCTLVICGHWLDMWLLVMPSKERFHDHLPLGPVEIGMAAGVIGLVALIIMRGLAKLPLVPTHDPVIEHRRQIAAHGH
ncbi:MAG TPA: hypothetical protein VFP84_07115 [Kofleriaceae bacterium]|nr:hypothetical protein [Kofleriaceae bacterium]